MDISWPLLTIGLQSVYNKIDVRWYVIASVALVPLVSIAGAAGNQPTITLMPRASVHISRRAKQFYCLVAVCDLLAVLSHYSCCTTRSTSSAATASFSPWSLPTGETAPTSLTSSLNWQIEELWSVVKVSLQGIEGLLSAHHCRYTYPIPTHRLQRWTHRLPPVANLLRQLDEWASISLVSSGLCCHPDSVLLTRKPLQLKLEITNEFVFIQLALRVYM